MGAFDPWEILDLIIQGISVSVLRPLEYPSSLFRLEYPSPLFWWFVLFIALLYRRLARMKANLFQIERESIWRPVMGAIAYGIIGGFIGSVLSLLFGITIGEAGFAFLFPVAVLLMLINARYMCFAYAGGLISLGAILFGWESVSVAQIMGLVGILHLVEAFLIFISGHQGNMPVYVANRRGLTVGAYNLQSFWPIPLLVLTLGTISEPSGMASAGMEMPSWWPLIAPPGVSRDLSVENLMYLPLPIVAVLGYGDLAVTQSPRDHSRRSALLLALYSLVLLGLAVLASHIPSLAILAALFGPLGHEALILWTQKRELEGRPLFVQSPWGVRVLAIGAASPAEKLGLKPGDVIGRVNGMAVHTNRDLAFAAAWSPTTVEVEYLPGGHIGAWRRATALKAWNEPFGVIPAPDEMDQPLVTVSTGGIVGRWLARWGKYIVQRIKQK